jgi:hypothetical protein
MLPSIIHLAPVMTIQRFRGVPDSALYDKSPHIFSISISYMGAATMPEIEAICQICREPFTVDVHQVTLDTIRQLNDGRDATPDTFGMCRYCGAGINRKCRREIAELEAIYALEDPRSR